MSIADAQCEGYCVNICKTCTNKNSANCINKNVSLFKVDPGNYILPSNMYFKSLKALTCFDISRY